MCNPKTAYCPIYLQLVRFKLIHWTFFHFGLIDTILVIWKKLSIVLKLVTHRVEITTRTIKKDLQNKQFSLTKQTKFYLKSLKITLFWYFLSLILL